MDPDDTIGCIKTELARPGLRSFIGSTTEVRVQQLEIALVDPRGEHSKAWYASCFFMV